MRRDPRPVRRHPSEGLVAIERLEFQATAQGMIAAGQRPCLRVILSGINGVSVRLVVHGMPGAIAHARTRRRACEIARAAVASTLRIDVYAFDLQVDGV